MAGNNRIFVRNLDLLTSDADLNSYFNQKFQGFLTGKIIRDLNGRSKGYGFITFINPLCVNTVLSEKHHVINGKQVFCKLASPKKTNLPKNFQKKAPKYQREIYVGNLKNTTKNEDLKEYFSRFGLVENAYVVLDTQKKSKRYGFVEFNNPSCLDKVQSERPHKICDSEVQTIRGYPKNVPLNLKKPSNVLYVLDYNDINCDHIEEYFGEFGDIISVSRIVKPKENKKYMEIHFDDYDPVDVICLADESHTINNSKVTVKKFLNENSRLQGTQTETSSSASKKTTRRDGSRNTQAKAQSAPTPSAPSIPIEELQTPPYNPHFVHNSLYPQLPNQPESPNFQTPRSPFESSSFIPAAKPVKMKDCVIS